LTNIATSSSSEIITLLLAHGADHNLTNNDGLKAEDLATNLPCKKQLMHAKNLETIIALAAKNSANGQRALTGNTIKQIMHYL